MGGATHSAAVDQSPGDALPPSLLRMEGIRKRFPGVQALDGVSLEIGRGELVALIGENGAGKSTLIKALAGIVRPDDGQIYWNGQPVRILSVQDSMRLGVGVIHQELNLSANVSIAENIYLGRQPRRLGWLGLVDGKRLNALAQEQLAQLRLDIPVTTRLGRLTIGQQQLVEIAKALSLDATLLVFDEPTSSLSSAETQTLFEVIRLMRRRGVGILYVSHRLAEVVELADRVQVLRDGREAGQLRGSEIRHDRMVRMMVGREVSRYYQHERHEAAGDPILRVSNLVPQDEAGTARRRAGFQRGVSFELRPGEIVGFAGLVGAGRSELARAVFGIDRIRSGTIEIDGRQVRIGTPTKAIAQGLGLVPEDRKQQGLILEMAISANISLAGLGTYRRFGLFDRRRELEVARRGGRDLGIRASSLSQAVRTLSGGNQQKVVLARWLALNPRVLILDEPTRGVDIGCKSEIYALMSRLVERGMAIWMISSEMEELLAMSDRVMVMHEGRIAGELKGSQITEEDIMMLAVGADER